MRKRKVALFNSGATWRSKRRAIAGALLTSLVVCAALLSHALLFSSGPASQAARDRQLQSAPPGRYLYYVLKQSSGFVLARARAGGDSQPTEAPHVVARFGEDFGQTTADTVISLQGSPDGHYLAIDGTRSDGEFVWIFDTRRLVLTLQPANISGTFLHWLPGSSDTFLYRPMFPRGPDAPLVANSWNPGLWEVNATTGAFTNIDIHVPAAFLVDAVPSPDGSQIVYSTSAGLGMGSTIWSMDAHGQHQKRLLQLSDDAQDIAGLFAWSPGGKTIAYERLADSPTPFLPASLWIMNPQGGTQHLLAQTDGGHGFALLWSPDGTKIAFVARTNPNTSTADQSMQSLKSAIEVIDVSSKQARMLAGPAQTGVQINADPVWSADSSQVTFVAFNPLNPELGGTIHYWTASANSSSMAPAAAQISQPITHVVAFG